MITEKNLETQLNVSCRLKHTHKLEIKMFLINLRTSNIMHRSRQK